jgi:hypothetical protein
MRIGVLLLIVVICLSCGGEGRSQSPPKLPDRAAELRKYDPAGDRFKPNPKPSPWMTGCYSIERPPALRWPVNEPETIQLTARPAESGVIQQRYQVWSGQVPMNLSSWMPVSATALDVNLGTGLSGCEFKLERAAGGLNGTGRRWSEVPDTNSPELPVLFHSVPCRSPPRSKYRLRWARPAWQSHGNLATISRRPLPSQATRKPGADVQVHSGIKPITLSSANWLFVSWFVLVVFPVALGFIFFDSVYAFYLSRYVAPELESSLGFSGGYAKIRTPEGERQSYVLTRVLPTGTLGLVGIRAGDIPCRSQHGVESGFLGTLHHSRGQQIDLTFCTPPGMTEKRVTIRVPRGDG